jgi:hypothetical protein
MKNFLRGMIGIVGLVLASSAIAAPTYLTCQSTTGRAQEIALNEETTTVSYTLFSEAQQTTGTWSAGKISWTTNEIIGLTDYVLDRVTLHYRSEYYRTSSSPIGPRHLIDEGVCKIEAAPDRQI